LITLPAAAGLMALKIPIVKLLFERGAFDAIATRMTADALFYFCLGMFAMTMIMVITRAYYALGDVRTPLYLGLLSIGVNIVASIALMPSLGHCGLALANTLAAIFNAVAMYVFLKKHLPCLYLRNLCRSVVKSLGGSFLTAITALVLYSYLSNSIFPGEDIKILLLNVLLSIVVGVTVYVFSLFLFREEEAWAFWQKVKAKAGELK
jgi:putative peptidoglycan lipid II flippase